MTKHNSIGIPESAKVIRGRPYVPLTDDFHQDEPLAYLVKCFDDTMGEYRVFGNYNDAYHFAVIQEQDSQDAGKLTGFDVYPLYASHSVTDG